MGCRWYFCTEEVRSRTAAGEERVEASKHRPRRLRCCFPGATCLVVRRAIAQLSPPPPDQGPVNTSLIPRLLLNTAECLSGFLMCVIQPLHY